MTVCCSNCILGIYEVIENTLLLRLGCNSSYVIKKLHCIVKILRWRNTPLLANGVFCLRMLERLKIIYISFYLKINYKCYLYIGQLYMFYGFFDYVLCHFFSFHVLEFFSAVSISYLNTNIYRLCVVKLLLLLYLCQISFCWFNFVHNFFLIGNLHFEEF